MNTTVGLQASLHSSLSNDSTTIMKNDSFEPSPIDSRYSNDAMEFDADELLKSPLFNDSGLNRGSANDASFGTSGENYFGSFALEGNKSTVNEASFGTFNMEDDGAPFEQASRSSSDEPYSYEGNFGADEHNFQPPSRSSSCESKSYDTYGENDPSEFRRQPLSRASSMSSEDLSTTMISNEFRKYDISMMQSGYDTSPINAVVSVSSYSSESHDGGFEQSHTGFGHGRAVSDAPGSQHSQLMQMRAALEQSYKRNEPVSRAPPTRTQSYMGKSSLSSSLHERPTRMQQRQADPLGSQSMHVPSSKSFNSRQEVNDQSPAVLTEAMEKLCDSMRRSAMTRTMVKQISSRSLSRAGSSRGVSRSNSAAMLSKRSLDDSGGRSVAALRRNQSAKHQLDHSGRGVYRNGSHQSLSGMRNKGFNLQVDGRNVGQF